MVTHVDNRVLAVVEPEEVEMVISSRDLAQENLIRSLFFAQNALVLESFHK